MTTIAVKWYCANCGRSNRTPVGPTGIAECEYCADVARVQPLQSWGLRLLRYAASLVGSLGESGCIQWRPVLARVSVPTGRTFGR